MINFFFKNELNEKIEKKRIGMIWKKKKWIKNRLKFGLRQYKLEVWRLN